MAQDLEFWFEFGSTYSYPAAGRVARVTRCGAARVRFRPFLLGPVFKAQGWDDSPFNLYPSKGRYMWRDVADRCQRLGLPWTQPTQFPRHGLLAARVCTALGEAHPSLPELVCQLYRANFADDRDIGERGVVADALQKAELDPEPWLARAGSEEIKGALRATTEQALTHGIFGAPSFIADGELFWGEDRLDRALDRVDIPCAESHIRLRPFRLDDRTAVIELWRRAGLITGGKRPAQDIAARMAAQPGLFLVALLAGQPVGSCMAGFDGHRGWLHLLAVDPDQQRRGIGTALVRGAEARLSALGCPKINLQVRQSNQAVVSFYERLAYQPESLLSLGKRLS